MNPIPPTLGFSPSGLMLHALPLCLALLAAPAATAQTDPSPSPLRQVIVVFKTHFDIGYTDLASNVVHRYRTTMIEEALRVVDQNRDLPPEQQFSWTLPGWPMQKISEDWEGQRPERKQRIFQAFQEGRFVIHALPFTTHTELLELEDLVRGLGFASDLSRSGGLDLPRDAKMTDVPCHAWVIPTLLRQAGVDFLHLGCNAASRSPQVPMLFWWEGPDGSRLLTMYVAAGYGTGLLPPKDWPYQTWLALIHTGDNHGPPTPSEVKTLLAEARQKLPDVPIRIGRLSDFADAIRAEGADLPVVRGDMPDSWIHGPMCDPAGAKLARTVRPLIATTELLGTTLRAWEITDAAPAAPIAAAYEQSLLYGEHTWGGALYWITSYAKDRQFSYGAPWETERAAGRFRKLEASWNEHSAYIRKAQELVEPLLHSHLQLLAHSVNLAGQRVLVFNPLPWSRSGVVSLPLAGTSLAPLQSGWALQTDGHPPAPVASDGNTLWFLARDIPASGYRTYRPVSLPSNRPPAETPHTASMENAFFKVALDPARGAIASLIDKQSGREWVDADASFGFGQYLYERFDADQVAAYVKAYVKINADWAVNELGKPALPSAKEIPYHRASPEHCKLTLEHSPVGITAVLTSSATARLPHALTTKIHLYHGLPYLDLEVTLHEKPATPWPEAGWICLPVHVDQPRFHLGRQSSIIDPAQDVVPGANRHLFGVTSGLTITDPEGRGIGICAPDTPLVSLGEPGCWKYSLEFGPPQPVAFINLFNNQWTTNFRLWNEGTWTVRLRLWAVDPYRPEEALITPSWEARSPLLAAAATGPPGTLPPVQSGLELSRKGVLVTAFGTNPDGPGTVLRLWELAGNSGPCLVRLPEGFSCSSVQPVNLRGQSHGDPIRVQDRAFPVTLHAFAPASFLIQPE